jgi:hypothetical protein
VDEGAVLHTAQCLDQLGDDPVGRRRVVLEARTRLPVEPPRAEAGEALLAGAVGCQVHWRLREASLVQQQLPDRDDVFAIRGELRDQLCDSLIEGYCTVAEQQPERSGDDCLRAGEDDVAAVRFGLSERLERHDPVAGRNSHLARGQEPLVDFSVAAGDEGRECSRVDPDLSGILDYSCVGVCLRHRCTRLPSRVRGRTARPAVTQGSSARREVRAGHDKVAQPCGARAASSTGSSTGPATVAPVGE